MRSCSTQDAKCWLTVAESACELIELEARSHPPMPPLSLGYLVPTTFKIKQKAWAPAVHERRASHR